MTELALLRIRGLSKVFADIPVLDRVDLDVIRGEVGTYLVRNLPKKI